MPDQTDRPAGSSARNLLAASIELVAEAPILYFDGAPVFGLSSGTGRITLEAIVLDTNPEGQVRPRRVAVAHLRGSAAALGSLAALSKG